MKIGPVPIFRYDAGELQRFAAALLGKAGLARERAAVVAETLLEADLLGFATHGLVRLPGNIKWLERGETRREGDPIVITDRGQNVVWDANFLPGPWVVRQGLDLLLARAVDGGTATMIIRRAQHIACLAAYLRRATDAGMILLLMVSTPGERLVVPFGGIDPVFSTNPIAAGLPTSGDPILIDTSTSIVSYGAVRRARAEGRRLGSPALSRSDGTVTDDPAALEDDPHCALLPVGGLDHGYKGFALGLLVEVLSAALGGYGCANVGEDGEANAVFMQAINPECFGGSGAYHREVDRIAALCRSSRPRPGQPPVRLPGDRACVLRREQLKNGVELRADVVAQLQELGAKLDVPFPAF
jgi:L-lactate dehydrogenase